MSAIEQCRTRGARRPCRCAATAASDRQIAYNSCRNRHCPKCQGAAPRSAGWRRARPTCCRSPYYHVVFTLPAPISAIAFHNKARDLRPAVRRRRRDAAHHRRRSQASRAPASALTAGAAHLGLGADPPSARARHRARRRPVARRRALGRLPAGLLPAGARALAAVPPLLPRRARRAPTRRASCSSSASTPRSPIAAAFAALARAAAPGEWVVYAKRPFAGPEAVLAYLVALHPPRRHLQQPPRRHG